MSGFQRITEKIKSSDSIQLLILLSGVFVLRVTGASIIGEGGFDAVEEFHAAKKILYGMDYGFIHRTARFAAILPQTFMVFLFGSNPVVYYFAPLIASLISTFFLFRTSVLIVGRTAAIAVVALYSVFPQVMVDGVHPRVSSFSVMYMLVALYFLVVFFQRCSQDITFPGSRLLVAAAVAVFCMYMAKEDTLFVLPVFFLMVWESRRRFRDLVLFAGLLLVLYLGETALYASFTEFRFGRLDVIMSGHLENINLMPVKSFPHLFDRFRPPHMPVYYAIMIFLSIAAGCYFTIRERFARSAARYLVLMIICYTGLMTFLVKSLTPLVPVNTFQSRYMNFILPLMFIVLGYAAKSVYARFKGPAAGSGIRDSLIVRIAFIFLIFVGLTSGVFLSLRHHEGSFHPIANHPFVRVQEYAQMINSALAAGQPVFVRGKSRGERFRPIIRQIDEWVENGMTLSEACKRYGITVSTYDAYRDRYAQIGTKGFGIVENILLNESYVRSHEVIVHSDPFEDGATFLFYDSGRYRPEDVLALYTADPGASFIVVSADPFTVDRSVVRRTDGGATRTTGE
jgi:hypothetical protein